MKRFLETLTAWEGAVRGDAVHKQIVDAYNSYLPHPRGHKLTYTDGVRGGDPLRPDGGHSRRVLLRGANALVSSARPMD